MKRKIVLLISFALLLACAFAIASYAEEGNVYYLVQDSASDTAAHLMTEGKNVVQIADLYSKVKDNGFFDNFADNSSVVIRLAENISYLPNGTTNNYDTSTFINLKKSISVRVEFFGYTWFIPDNLNYAGWRISHHDACLTMVGTKGVGEDMKPVIIENPSIYTNELNTEIDFHGGWVGVLLTSGSVNAECFKAVASEEIFYQRGGSGNPLTYTFKNCSLASTKKGISPINLRGGGGLKKILQIENCYLSSLSMDNMQVDSYVKDTVISKNSDGISIYHDSWLNRNEGYLHLENCVLEGSYRTIGDGLILKAVNSKIGGSLILPGDSSGGACVELIDTEFNGTVDFYNKSGYVTVIKSPTCQEEGTSVKTTKDGVASEETLEKVPHTFDKSNIVNISYSNYFENGYYVSPCAVCAEICLENEASAGPIFRYMGYSCTEKAIGGTYSMAQCYGAYDEMLKEYKGYNGDFEFGLVASSVANPFAEENKGLVNEGKVVICDGSSFVNSYFEIKIRGIKDTDEFKNKAIVFCLYVNDGEAFYLDNGKTSSTVMGITYNSVLEKQTTRY